MSVVSQKGANWITAIATVVVAVATVVGACTTIYYAWLTQKLVRVQTVPALDWACDQPLAKKLLLGNAGAEPISKIQVWWDFYPFSQPSARFFYAEPSPARLEAWWDIGELRPGDIQSKDLSELTQLVGQNADAFHEELLRNPPKRATRRPTVLLPGGRLVFRVRYRRAVDLAPYNKSLQIRVNKDAQTNKYFLWCDLSTAGSSEDELQPKTRAPDSR